MKRWYVAYTRNGMERMAEGNLEQQGFRAYLPRRRKQRRHARRITDIRVPLFPRYIFVELDTDRDRWRSINGTFGIAYLITNNERPAAVPPGVVEEIIAVEDADGLVPIFEAPPFEAGDKVEVTDGLMRNQIGRFKCANDNDRVTILLGLLGRETEFHLPAAAVRAYG